MPDQARNLAVNGRVPRAMQLDDASMDIFVMVKQLMSSTTLSQPPLLAWPSSLQPVCQHAMEVANDVHRCPTIGCGIDEARKAELRDLQTAFVRDFPHFRRTCAWYQKMIDGVEEDGCRGIPPLTFLQEARAAQFDVSQFELGQRQPLPKPHELQVVFHRGWSLMIFEGDGSKKKMVFLCFQRMLLFQYLSFVSSTWTLISLGFGICFSVVFQH